MTAVGTTTYKVSDTITGLDTGPPEITISTPSTDPEQSKTFSATATDATALVSGTTDATATTWIFVLRRLMRQVLYHTRTLQFPTLILQIRLIKFS